MTRGALYIVFDGYDPRVDAALERSIKHLAIVHPELPVHVERLTAGSTLLDKAKMADITPFDSTVFLDADTVVLGRLDHGFHKAEIHGLACCICECPWARRFSGLRERGDIQEYNTGVLFFTKGAAEVFDGWKQNIAIDSSLQFLGKDGAVETMPYNDQAAFALAIDDTVFNPWVLPKNWNYRPIWEHTLFGPCVIYHDYAPVPEGLFRWNREQAAPDAVLSCGRLT